MTSVDFMAVGPLLAVALGAVGTLVGIAIRRSCEATSTLALASLVAAIGLTATAFGVAPRQVTPLLLIDGYGVFFLGLLLLASLVVLMLSIGYLRDWRGQVEEYYTLLLLSTLGAGVMVVSTHFASFFLGLELLGIPLYALIAYCGGSQKGVEAGFKYLILAGVGSALLLMGMALVYAAFGSLSFVDLSRATFQAGAMPLWALGGGALIICGLGFKLALAPMHMWAADIYEGAPFPITSYIATVSKGAVLVLLLRYLAPMLDGEGEARTALSFLAVASMFVGNLLALRQDNLKRMLGYSSIAHMGYLLVAVMATKLTGTDAVGFYLTAYFASVLAALGVLTVLSSPQAEIQMVADLRAVAWRRPGLGITMTVSMLSLAGIPLTVGFFGKFYVLLSGVDASLWGLVLALVINSVIGLFYYLRVIAALFAEPDATHPTSTEPVSLMGSVVLSVLTMVMIGLGAYPAPLIFLIDKMTR